MDGSSKNDSSSDSGLVADDSAIDQGRSRAARADSEPAGGDSEPAGGDSGLAGADARSEPGPTAISPWRVTLFAALAVTGATTDLWTKTAIFRWRGLPGQRDVWWIWQEHFGIETAVNPGAVFGLGAGMGIVFATLSVAALVGILGWLFWFRGAQSLWLTFALGLVSGGVIGNLYDRLGFWWREGYPLEWKSGVRDWILVRFEGVPFFDPWPNFNIADSLLVVGACMLLYQSFFLSDPIDETGSSPASSGSEADRGTSHA